MYILILGSKAMNEDSSNIIPTVSTTCWIHAAKFHPLKGIQWSDHAVPNTTEMLICLSESRGGHKDYQRAGAPLL